MSSTSHVCISGFVTKAGHRFFIGDLVSLVEPNTVRHMGNDHPVLLDELSNFKVRRPLTPPGVRVDPRQSVDEILESYGLSNYHGLASTLKEKLGAC